jgi:CubicO group peptidase (beta-lactamase class C family)
MIMLITKNILVSLFLAFSVLYGNAQPSKIDTTALNLYIKKLIKKNHVPNTEIAVIKDDSIIYNFTTDKDNSKKNYLIGSCSKSFTALATLKLIEEGNIGLDNPIRQYLPWFEMKNKHYTDSVTVRHLLNHKSGFERQYGYFDPKTDDAATYEKKLAEYIKNIDVRYFPGTAFQYSNLNYVLLGLIIKSTTHQTYSDYMTKSVLPLIGMKNTYFTYRNNQEHNLIQPYQYLIWPLTVKSKNYYYSDNLVPCGYISSNINDLSNYLKFMLHKTVTSSGDTILSLQRYSELTGGNRFGYAMGWFHFVYDSINVVCHTGLNENFTSSLNLYPDLGIGSIAICNVNSFEFCSEIDNELRSQILGKQNPGFNSSEKLMRQSAFILPVVLLLGLFINLKRWKKYGFHFGFYPKILPIFRILIGIFLSVLGLIQISKMYQIFIPDMLRFGPDLGWGLILIAFFGVTSSIIRYFGTYAKTIAL